MKRSVCERFSSEHRGPFTSRPFQPVDNDSCAIGKQSVNSRSSSQISWQFESFRLPPETNEAQKRKQLGILFKSCFLDHQHPVAIAVVADWHSIYPFDRKSMLSGVELLRHHLVISRRRIRVVVVIVLRAFDGRSLWGFCSRRRWLRGGVMSVVAVRGLVPGRYHLLGLRLRIFGFHKACEPAVHHCLLG